MSLASLSSASLAPFCRSPPCPCRSHPGRTRRALPFSDARSQATRRCQSRVHGTGDREDSRDAAVASIPAATAVALLLSGFQPLTALAATASPAAGMQAGSAAASDVAQQLVPQLMSAGAGSERCDMNTLFNINACFKSMEVCACRKKKFCSCRLFARCVMSGSAICRPLAVTAQGSEPDNLPSEAFVC